MHLSATMARPGRLLLLHAGLLLGAWATDANVTTTTVPADTSSTSVNTTVPADTSTSVTTTVPANASSTSMTALNESAEATTTTAAAAATCGGATAVPVGGSGTDCPAAVQEGGRCRATCGAGEVAAGGFVCGAGQIWGVSACVSSAATSPTVVVDMVVGSLSLEMPSCPAPQALVSIFAETFGVAPGQILRVRCAALASARRLSPRLRGLASARELQAAQRQGVLYELVVRNGSDVSAGNLTLTAAQIPTNGSAANGRFAAAFASEGLAAPTAVSATIPPRQVSGVVLPVDASGGFVVPAATAAPTPAPAPAEAGGEESGPSKRLVAGLAIGGGLVLLGLLCLGVVCCCARRRRRDGGSFV